MFYTGERRQLRLIDMDIENEQLLKQCDPPKKKKKKKKEKKENKKKEKELSNNIKDDKVSLNAKLIINSSCGHRCHSYFDWKHVLNSSPSRVGDRGQRTGVTSA